MVAICAAILSKTEALLCRQFLPLTRLRVEALVSKFFSLIDAMGTERSKTILESDSVRYLFVPVENLYLVLITDKASNIIVDTETLRTFQQLVVALCPSSVNAESVSAASYELLFAMDELVAFGGHREYVSVADVQEYLAMESTEEKLQEMIRKSKESEENERRRKRAIQLDREKLAAA